MLTTLRNSLANYFKPPRAPSKRQPPDKGGRLRVVGLRSGGAAQRSDCLQVGDTISAINGTRVHQMGADQIDQMLAASNERIHLEIEYELPPTPTPTLATPTTPTSSVAGSTVTSSSHLHAQHQQQRNVVTRTKEVFLAREASDGAGFGFILRGGHPTGGDATKLRPLVITYIRPNSPAEREGTVQVGDRLVSVNGQTVHGLTLAQAQKIIRDSNEKLVIGIEYDVSLVDTGRYAQGPVLVEVHRTPGAFLGISLVAGVGTGVFIESVAPASIAERCGALHAGDQILAVGDVRLDDYGELGPQEATRLLRNYAGDVVKLILVPAAPVAQRAGASSAGSRRNLHHLPPTPPPASPRPSQCSTLTGLRNRLNSAGSRSPHHALYQRILTRADSCTSSGRLDAASVSSLSTQSGHWATAAAPLAANASTSSSCGQIQLSHPESVSVTLQIDCRGSYGLTLAAGNDPQEPPVVLAVEPSSPADRTGCIQPGDRILGVNQQSTAGLTVDQVFELIKDSKPRVVIDLEFDVADSVVPASGVFWVKLVRRGQLSYGLSLSAPKFRHGNVDHLVISEVRPGSVAHRTGTVHAGDKLLAVDGSQMDAVSLEDATLFLQTEEVVRLKLQKGESEVGPVHDHLPVVYTVELVRHGGPLGVTISGTENPNDSIVISGLTEGGLAERTGALHVGDRLLAINGRSLHGKPLSECVEILQSSTDIVTLKIGKSSNKLRQSTGELERDDYLPLKLPPLPSIDSAVESWVSGASRAANGDNAPIYTAESATVRRRQKHNSQHEWEALSSPSLDSGQFEVTYAGANSSSTPNSSYRQNAPSTDDCANSTSSPSAAGDPVEDTGCPRMSDLVLVQRCNTLPRNYRKIINQRSSDDGAKSPASFALSSPFPVAQSSNLEIHQITLQKDSVYEDFGFSVSDGLYERGVYVNRVRKGGPADVSSMLQPFDRILHVNETRTYDFDCCLAVPLIAAAGDSITLVIGRNPLSTHMDLKDHGYCLNWNSEDDNTFIPADADDCGQSSCFVGVRTITTTL